MLEAHLNANPSPVSGHTTRMWPKREAELVAGGSLYWVIKGVIQARQEIVELQEVIGADGIRRCKIVLQKPLIRTQNSPRRAFQGWRYLTPADAPPDMPKTRESDTPLPEELAQELARIGLM